MTLVFLKSLQIEGVQFTRGDELAPGLLSEENISLRLDRKELVETDRRGLHKICHRFSGSSERESLSVEEKREFSL